MAYKYERERADILTDRGQKNFLKIRDQIKVLLESAGSFKMSVILSGDCWECMACVDRLVELGEIVEVNKGPDVRGQDRVFIAKRG